MSVTDVDYAREFATLAEALVAGEGAWIHFTCGEVNQIVDSLVNGGQAAAASKILGCHAHEDEDYDDYVHLSIRDTGSDPMFVGLACAPGSWFPCLRTETVHGDVVPVMTAEMLTYAHCFMADQECGEERRTEVLDRGDLALFSSHHDVWVSIVGEDGLYRPRHLEWYAY